MYSLIRSLIGREQARMLIHDQRRRQDDEDERQAVDAELVLDPEERDPVGASLDELERPRRAPASKPTTSSSETTHVDERGRRARAAARSGPARSAMTSAPTSGRKVTSVRIGIASIVIVSGPPARGTSRP